MKRVILRLADLNFSNVIPTLKIIIYGSSDFIVGKKERLQDTQG